jgi:hypothetical protein
MLTMRSLGRQARLERYLDGDGFKPSDLHRALATLQFPRTAFIRCEESQRLLYAYRLTLCDHATIALEICYGTELDGAGSMDLLSDPMHG